MFIIVGGTGRVGSATAGELLAQRQPVTIVTRNPAQIEPWRRRGAEVAIADVRDSAALRAIFRRGRRAFLLNPPASPATDTDVEERATVRGLLDALESSGLEQIVAQSTYGARPGASCGDLAVLHELETGLRAQRIPATILRSAYMMSNWDSALDASRPQPALMSFLPRDLVLPMVAPADLGAAAARFLRETARETTVRHVEGPARYTPADVAAAFSRALHRPVALEVIPRARWEKAFRSFGFSPAAARSYANMTAATIDTPELPESPIRGTVSLESYILDAARRNPATP